ncbi:MAG: cache domain-containing protein [Acidithiobacillus ferrivorans]
MARENTLTREFLRHFIPAVLLNAVLVLGILALGQYLLIRQAEDQELSAIRNEFHQLTAGYAQQVLGAASALAGNPGVMAAFATAPSASQRTQLGAESDSLYRVLKSQYGQAVVVFIANQHVLYRANKPAFFGDHIIPRPDISQVIKTGLPVANLGLLKLVGYSVSGVAPVLSSDGSALGVAQVSLPIASLYGRILHDIPGSGIAILIHHSATSSHNVHEKMLGNNVVSYVSSPDLQEYIAQHPHMLHANYTGIARLKDGEFYHLFVMPLTGYDKKPLGLAVFGYNVTNTLRIAAITLGASLILSALVFLLIGLNLKRFIERRILAPVVELAKRLRAISLGERLEQSLEQTETNEIGILQTAAERLRKTLLNMLSHIKKPG